MRIVRYKMNRLKIVTVCVMIAAAVAVAVAVASRSRRQPAPPPDVPVAVTPAELCVKAVERKAELVERGESAAASAAVAIVCGMDEATADRYEARNDALRSIARRRDLPKNDVDALLVYLRRADDAMRIERVAALKSRRGQTPRKPYFSVLSWRWPSRHPRFRPPCRPFACRRPRNEFIFDSFFFRRNVV